MFQICAKISRPLPTRPTSKLGSRVSCGVTHPGADLGPLSSDGCGMARRSTRRWTPTSSSPARATCWCLRPNSRTRPTTAAWRATWRGRESPTLPSSPSTVSWNNLTDQIFELTLCIYYFHFPLRLMNFLGDISITWQDLCKYLRGPPVCWPHNLASDWSGNTILVPHWPMSVHPRW